MTVGTHRVRWWPVGTPTGGGTDLTCDVTEASILHGRSDPSSQPDASTLSMSLPDKVPDSLDVGALVTVETQLAGVWYPRFTGRVTDLSVTWELGGRGPDDVEADVMPRAQVTAAGPLADAGRYTVGDAPWPRESDGARAARVLALMTTIPPVTGEVDPGTIDLLARDVDLRAALDVLHDTANDGGGILWESVDGLLNYADAEHRRNATPVLALDACDVLMAPTWSRTKAGLVNVVALAYGVPAGGGTDQPVTTSTNAPSVTVYGRYAYSVTTQIADLANAMERAELLTVRGGSPAWNVSELPLDLTILSDAQSAAVLGLEVHDLLQLTGQPDGTPGGATTSLWIEGWAERLTYGGHVITYAVSAYCRTVPPPRWNDVLPAQTWDTTPASLTWDSATCNAPQPSQGRWDDVAASLRWDDVPAGTTWDTWAG